MGRVRLLTQHPEPRRFKARRQHRVDLRFTERIEAVHRLLFAKRRFARRQRVRDQLDHRFMRPHVGSPGYISDRPPSSRRICPVTYVASIASHATAAAASSGAPARARGTRLR